MYANGLTAYREIITAERQLVKILDLTRTVDNISVSHIIDELT